MIELTDWVTLTKITDPVTASLLKGRLMAEGIPVIMRTGEAAGSLYGLTTGPLAEIKIIVPTHNLNEARELLKRIEENQEPESFEELEEEPE